MGRLGKRGGNHIGELEVGKKQHVTLAFVADYLRACRATFAEIAPVLDEYTRQPVKAETRAQKIVATLTENLPEPVRRATRKYDTKLAQSAEPEGSQPEVASSRIRRAQRYAAAAIWRDRLHRRIVQFFNRQRLGPGLVAEMLLQAYARKLWAVLSRTRTQSRSRRKALLAEVEAKMIASGAAKPEHIRAVSKETVAYFLAVEQSGDLDRPIGR